MAVQDPAKAKKTKRKRTPSDVPTTSLAPVQLSAVAARRLARQQAAQEEQSLPKAAGPAISVPREEGTTHENGIEEAEEGSSSSASSDEDFEQISKAILQTKNAVTGSERSARYFQHAPSPPSTATKVPNSAVTSDEDMSMVTEEDDDDSDNEPVAGPSSARTPISGHSTNTSAQRTPRRRKGDNARAAFTDPTCISTWHPQHSVNYFPLGSSAGQGGYLLALHPGESVIVKGCCSLSIVRGRISANAAVISSKDTVQEPLAVFAPTTHHLPVMRALRPQTSHEAQPQLSEDFRLDCSLPEHEVLIVLQDLQTGVEEIESVCRTAGMPIPQNGMWTSSRTGRQAVSGRTFEIITNPERDLIASSSPSSWAGALLSVSPSDISHEQEVHHLDEQERRQVYLVQGGKGAGKSTFSKMLVNTLLNKHPRVAYLDTDLGQPSFTPPGSLSLHVLSSPLLSPSFISHHHLPARSHYLGWTTPKNMPSQYLDCVARLIEHYTSELEAGDGVTDTTIPLVVNTQGWVKGLGADLAEEIKRLLQPGTVFDFAPLHAGDFDDSSMRRPGEDLEEQTCRTIPLQSILLPEPGPTKLNAADLRTLSLVSYFHLLPSSFVSSPSASPSWDFSTSVVTKRPYAVPFSAFKHIELSTSERVERADILRALDVSLVALATSSTGEFPDDTAPSSASIAYDPELPAGSAADTTLGLALVRAVDLEAASFHVLTPLPTSILARCTGMIKGDVEIPTVLMIDYADNASGQEGGDRLCGVEWSRVPYLEATTGESTAVGARRRRVRRNVMRRSQM